MTRPQWRGKGLSTLRKDDHQQAAGTPQRDDAAERTGGASPTDDSWVA